LICQTAQPSTVVFQETAGIPVQGLHLPDQLLGFLTSSGRIASVWFPKVNLLPGPLGQEGTFLDDVSLQ
jgi:hypothetical protein